MSSEWYVVINGEQKGPFTKEQLHNMVGNDELKPAHLVWSAGMPDWITAKEVSGLFENLSTPPPPPPPIQSSPPPPPLKSSTQSSAHQEKALNSYQSVDRREPPSPAPKKNNTLVIILAVVGVVVIFTGVLIASGVVEISGIMSGDPAEEETVSDITGNEGTADETKDEKTDETTDTVAPDYNLVHDAIADYIRDEAGLTDFKLAPAYMTDDYDTETFFDMYKATEVFVYDFEETGTRIEVDLGWPYSEVFSRFTLEWENGQWVVKDMEEVTLY